MQTVAIYASIGMVILAIISLCIDADDYLPACVICAVLHCGLLVTATVLFCLLSPEASYGGGIFFTITTCLLIGVQVFFEDYFPEKRALALAMSVADFACAAVCYLSVYDFLPFAISFAVIFLLAGINIYATFVDNDWSDAWPFHVLNILLAAAAAPAFITGFCFFSQVKDGVTVQAECGIYAYDYVNSTVDKNAQSDLYFNENYAMRLSFKWDNLMAYTTHSEKVRIQVTFPAAVDYVSDGVGFKSSADKKVWTYDFELNSKSKSRLKSGHFIFNYKYDNMSIPVKPFNVHVGLVPPKNSTDKDKEPTGFLKKFDYNYKYTFKRRNYPFTKANCLKDLSQAEDGYYRITPPDGCRYLKINIYDRQKTGIYYSGTVSVGSGYYLLAIPQLLKQNVSESVFDKIMNDKQSLVVEVIAVGNSDYDDTAVEIVYTV